MVPHAENFPLHSANQTGWLRGAGPKVWRDVAGNRADSRVSTLTEQIPSGARVRAVTTRRTSGGLACEE